MTSSPLSLSRSKSKVSEPGITLSLGYPLLFHWAVLGLVLILLFVSAVTHVVPLLAISVFFLVLALVSRLWSRWSLRGVPYNMSISQSRAFPGEKLDLNFAVTNGKWLPLPWLEIEAELPLRLATGSLKTSSPYTRERVGWTTSVSGGQQVRWKYQLECKARGEYRLGPVRLRSGDICGLFPREIVLPHFVPLLVYPRIDPLYKLDLPLKELFGETEVSKGLYEDTNRTVGARDYWPGDPFKRIHWKVSAAHGQLFSRQYESSASLSLLLILDVYSFYQQEPDNPEPFERAVTMVASLAYQAHREDYSVGLIANSLPAIQIPTHSGRSQLLTVLESLARIEPRARLPLHEHLEKTVGGLPMGATLVIITNVPTPSLTGLVRKLKSEGHSLSLVNIGQPGQAGDVNLAPVQPMLSADGLSLGQPGAK